MTTEQFFQAVSQAVSTSIYEIFFLAVILASMGGYIFHVTVLKPRRYMRAKTAALTGYLRERHNLTDEEWSALERAARRAQIVPAYLAVVSAPSFDACRDGLRHELNDDRRVADLAFKLFND